jgi:ABC-2 type transport system permease protein
MRMLVIAPFPRSWIIVSRTLSATLVGLTQAAIFLAVLMLLGFVAHIPHPVLLVSGYLLTALACASLGMLIAVFSEALDDFAVIMNFVIFPVFFLSGALYPLQNLPDVLRMLALINPFSYGVDLLKHALLSDDVGALSADLALIHDIAFLVLFVFVAVATASIRFSRAPVLENLAKRLSTPRR